jgi:Icc-related predicted phosphoesterase
VRIVAVADTHLYTSDFAVPAGDVLVHAGDMCRAGTLEELAEAAKWLRSLPHRHKVIVAGNHDCVLEDQADVARELLAGFTYLEDSEVTIKGVRFYGSPWQPAYNDWAFNLPRGEPLAAKWRRIPTGIDVLVTHGPPEGIGDLGDMGMPGRGGCADLRQRVAEAPPRLHLFGHIHQDGGIWRDDTTTYANVTTWECERAPTVIDVEADRIVPIVVPPHGRRD